MAPGSHPTRHHFQRCYAWLTAVAIDEPALRAALWESSGLKALLCEPKGSVVASSATVSHCHRHFYKEAGVQKTPAFFFYIRPKRAERAKRATRKIKAERCLSFSVFTFHISPLGRCPPFRPLGHCSPFCLLFVSRRQPGGLPFRPFQANVLLPNLL